MTAIWFAMIDGDEKDAFKPRLLDDPRVVHLWDEDKVIGRWFAENMELEGCDDVEPCSDLTTCTLARQPRSTASLHQSARLMI